MKKTPHKPAKRGVGRPPLGADARSVTKTIKLTASELNAQERTAYVVSQTWTKWVREALREAVARGTPDAGRLTAETLAAAVSAPNRRGRSTRS